MSGDNAIGIMGIDPNGNPRPIVVDTNGVVQIG